MTIVFLASRVHYLYIGVYGFANGQSTYIQARPALVYLIVI